MKYRSLCPQLLYVDPEKTHFRRFYINKVSYSLRFIFQIQLTSIQCPFKAQVSFQQFWFRINYRWFFTHRKISNHRFLHPKYHTKFPNRSLRPLKLPSGTSQALPRCLHFSRHFCLRLPGNRALRSEYSTASPAQNPKHFHNPFPETAQSNPPQ